MALNLKNPHTLRLIDELARQTGKSKSDAVASAVEASLAGLLRERVETSEQRLARIQELAQDSAARFAAAGMGPDPQTGLFRDLVGDLYDAEGLPR